MARAPMLGRLVAALLALGLGSAAPAPALAQGVPVYQMGTVQPGNVATFGRNGQIVDGGIGNMFGPGGALSTTVNEPAIWDNTTGTLTKDGRGVDVAHSDTQSSAITTFGSPFAAYSNKANGVTAAYVNQCIYSTTCTDFGVFYDVFRSVLVTPPNSTTPIQNGYGSWIINSTARNLGISAFPNTSNFWGGSVADADYAGVWGSTLILTDRKGQVKAENPAPRYLFGQEISFNFMSSNSGGNALQFTGQSLVQVAGANAIALYHLDGFGNANAGNVAKWASMNYSADGATNYFALVGAVNMPGQVVGSISGTTMTVTSVTSGRVSLGASLSTASGGFVSQHLTGTLGGVGTYQVSVSQTVASGTIYFGANSQAIVLNGYAAGDASAITATMQMTPAAELQFIAPTSIKLQVLTTPIAQLSTAGAIITGTLGVGMASPQSTLSINALSGGASARVYNLFTDASNGEWFEASWFSDVLFLGTSKNGAGVARSMSIRTGEVEAIAISPNQLVTFAAPFISKGYTVAALPAGVLGGRAHVTNQLTACPATGAALTGGGAVNCPAFYNGTAWVGG